MGSETGGSGQISVILFSQLHDALNCAERTISTGKSTVTASSGSIAGLPSKELSHLDVYQYRNK